ncbi:Fur family transcriptional regulator, zinc uptake regulator [Pseudorhodobacter antarcticus]|jgi:Fur family zinc uptake transcriptional regulator|uniref:Fur family transcriptional regulator, zinc uptake regulator n=1 Tax=Pseudorhodobacter antarcticus TaxID=1077947 RepID=A0A1H8LF59_9RHOB|nr:Fur family transcriptional regulator [Pseudorhodobacter antarcticus]SEO03689.1 Fur family transcriptional regulator, zinc uptake regulator [Pseudorhodobacter antarcticus]
MSRKTPDPMVPPVESENDRMVLDVIRTANGPLAAYDILERLRPSRPKIAPPTVYRALEHLIRDGRVRRIESLNAYLSAGQDSAGHSVVFAICDDCGRVQERHADAAVGRLTKALSVEGFKPTRPVIEMHGRCGDCDGLHAAGGKA